MSKLFKLHLAPIAPCCIIHSEQFLIDCLTASRWLPFFLIAHCLSTASSFLKRLCVQVAVACIKVASQAVSTMPSLFFFPILPFLMTTCLIIYWVAVAGYLYSAGDVTIKTVAYSASDALTLSVWSHVVCCCDLLHALVALSSAAVLLPSQAQTLSSSRYDCMRSAVVITYQHASVAGLLDAVLLSPGDSGLI